MAYRAFGRNLSASYFAPFVIAMVALAAIVLWQIHDQASVTHWVERSDQVMLLAKNAQIELRNIEVAYRGYLVFPEQRYVTALGAARIKFTTNLSELSALVADNPDQEEILVKITESKDTWIEAIERRLAQKNGGPSDPDVIAAMQPQADGVFNLLEEFLTAEQRLARNEPQTRKNLSGC